MRTSRLAGLVLGVVGMVLGAAGAQGAPAGPEAVPALIPGPELEYEWESGTASKVLDGDTLNVRIVTSNSGNKGTQRVRTIGVQAPETGHDGGTAQCGSAQAKAALKVAAPPGTQLQLRALEGTSYDRYSGGRIVRSIYARDDEGNWFDTARKLVSNGTLLWFPLSATSPRKPEWAHNLEYRVLADDAAAARRGLWKANYCGTAPSSWAKLRMWVGYDMSGSYERAWIANDSSSNVPIGGWTFRDAALNHYTFPKDARIPAGGTVELRLASGRTTSPTGPFYVNSSTWFSNLPAKNDSFVGDAAYLMDNAGPYQTGNLRTWFAYPCNPDTCNTSASNPLRGKVAIASIRATEPNRRAPSRPQAVVAQSAANGSGTIKVTWTAPADLGGPAGEIEYTVTATPATGAAVKHVDEGRTTSRTFSGLEPGVRHTFRVTAINPQGSATSAATGAVAATTRPAAPTDVIAEPRDSAAVVSWSAPSSDGFRQVTGYDVQVTAAGLATRTVSTSGAATSLSVAGLVNGRSYSFAVRARVGTGSSTVAGLLSAASAAVPAPYAPVPSVPAERAAAPDAPEAPKAVARSASEVVVSWLAPADNGTQIAGYRVANTTGGTVGAHTCSTSAGVRSCIVGGLRAGAAYRFSVTATSAAGNSGPSKPSGPASPAAYPVAPAGPTTPTAIVGVEEPWQSNEEIVLKNISDSTVRLDGYAIYDAQARSGKYDSPDLVFPPNVTIPAGGTRRILTGSDLTPKSSRPDNPVFTGADNFLTNSGDRVELAGLNKALVTCRAYGGVSCAGQAAASTPTQPVGVTARTTPTSVTIQWGAPISRGGKPITAYTATAFSATNAGTILGTCRTDGAGRSCSFPGRVGTKYYAEVVATNAVGQSAPSAPRVLAGPRTAPSAPSAVHVVGARGGARVIWKPSAPNGAEVTSYTAAAYTARTGGRAAASCVASPGAGSCTIRGLKHGTRYYVDVRSTNRAGTSAPSSPRTAATPAGPSSAITTFANSRITVRWEAPPAGSPAIKGYTARVYTKDSGGSLLTTCSAGPAATSCTTGPLKPRSSYYVGLTTLTAGGWFTAQPRIATGPPQPPGRPSLASATASGRRVTLVWASPTFGGYTALTAYEARLYSKARGGSVVTRCSSPATVTRCTIQQVKKGTHHATVRVRNAKGWSDWSARVPVVVR
ncbi:MAG: fibronectin type III domain-containing protein [Candidatus Nanopelagicales bacterium]